MLSKWQHFQERHQKLLLCKRKWILKWRFWKIVTTIFSLQEDQPHHIHAMCLQTIIIKNLVLTIATHMHGHWNTFYHNWERRATVKKNISIFNFNKTQFELKKRGIQQQLVLSYSLINYVVYIACICRVIQNPKAWPYRKHEGRPRIPSSIFIKTASVVYDSLYVRRDHWPVWYTIWYTTRHRPDNIRINCLPTWRPVTFLHPP